MSLAKAIIEKLGNTSVSRRLIEASQSKITVKAKGLYAEFSIGLTSPHKLSSIMMPPSVASGIMGAYILKPPMRWLPIRIAATKYPRSITLTKNEPQSFPSSDHQQIRHTMLADVEYVIEIIPAITMESSVETSSKFKAIFLDRLLGGQQFYPPVLGISSCFADVSLCDSFDEAIKDSTPDAKMMNFKEAMFYCRKLIGYKTFKNIWFKSETVGGVMHCEPWNVLEKSDVELLMNGIDDTISVNQDGTYKRFYHAKPQKVRKARKASK